MSKHTPAPGPWMVTRGAQADPFSIEGPDCTIAHAKTAKGEAEANAHLIAAAPDLLEALKDLLARIDYHCQVTGRENCLKERKAARAAIAKAEGTQ